MKKLQIKAGIAIKPETSVEEIIPYLDKIDMVLVMTVEPGYGGQKLIKECLEKVKRIRQISEDIDIEVDGGITVDNIKDVIISGANVIVAGTTIILAKDKKDVIRKLRGE